MDHDSSIGLLFFALALLYFVTFAVALMRVSKIYPTFFKWRQSLLFYCTIILQTGMRGSFFLIISMKLSLLSNEILFLLITVPDSVFIVSFMVLGWQFIAVFYYSHIDSSIEERFLSRIALKPQARCSRELGLYLMLTWLCLQGTLYIMYIFNDLDDSQLRRELGISNIIFAGFAVALMVCLQLNYSGSPVRSEEWRDRLKLISWVLLVWTTGRVYIGSISLAESYSDNLIDAGIDVDSLVLIATPWMISSLVVSELVCYYVALDANVVPILVSNDNPPRHSSVPLVTSENLPSMFSYIPTDRNISESELSLGSELVSRRHALGSVRRGVYRDQAIIYRKIEFRRLSGYVLEELAREVENMPTYECSFLVPVVGVVTASPCLGIVTPYMSNGSLAELLNSSLSQLSNQQRLQVMIDVAQCLSSLHAKDLYHGHLTSHNILLDDQFRGYVSDYGLHKVKKYAGLMLNYTNKSAWSSPEQLKERSSTVQKPTPYDDIYSFGMVLWEVETGQVPFPGYSRKMLTQKVGLENYRPQIPENVPDSISDLIKACWNTDPCLRPDFELIESTLHMLHKIA
jgi:hypothetical protein